MGEGSGVVGIGEGGASSCGWWAFPVAWGSLIPSHLLGFVLGYLARCW